MSDRKVLPFVPKAAPSREPAIEKTRTPRPGLSLTLSLDTNRLARLLRQSLDDRTKDDPEP